MPPSVGYLIDPPDPFGPTALQDWEEHLADLRTLDQSAPEVRMSIELARGVLLDLQKMAHEAPPAQPSSPRRRPGSRPR